MIGAAALENVTAVCTIFVTAFITAENIDFLPMIVARNIGVSNHDLIVSIPVSDGCCFCHGISELRE